MCSLLSNTPTLYRISHLPFEVILKPFTLNLPNICSVNERGDDHVFTENDWALKPTPTMLAYNYSKREAEKAAWAIAEKQTRQGNTRKSSVKLLMMNVPLSTKLSTKLSTC